MKRILVSSAFIAVTALGLGACGSAEPTVKEPQSDESTSSETTGGDTTDDADAEGAAEEDAAAEEDEPSAAVGTRQNPAPAGSTIKLGEYSVSLGVTATNANDAVAAENQFNEPPVAGRQFLMVPVTATYNGSESGLPWLDLSVNFVGSAGNTYGGSGSTDDYCGVIPVALSDQGEIYGGATSAGNVCVSVPSAEIEGGTWVVEESLSFDDSKVFFALQ